MKRLFLLAFSLLMFGVLSAQKTADIGIWGGVGTYTGDMTSVNYKSSLGPAAGAFVRYNFNPRYSLRGTVMVSDLDVIGSYESHPWEFGKMVTDVSAMFEFNFFRYIMGSKRHPITPYLLVGLGVSLYPYDYDPEMLAGVVPYLNTNSAPNLPSGYDKAYRENVVAANIPLGFGFKFNVGERLSVGMEGQIRKYLDDRLDNLDDPLKYYTATGENAGYWTTYNDALHNNDWTFHFGVHLSYLIYRGGKKCPAYDNIN
ncbi:DUF6089 family protein [Gaoshiqia sediminis]|uniref:DUF6089 family protein n=1 Tax=Gaoshiqia sediminis TaxID=2986998 RepID=A0AA41Y9Y9_9BACT|nr:DUF6089 family protein [Gaoshiqia sediminis]MCW0484361.1 DUF6089 family protein [Gaoshiqia sediminis]